MTRVLVPVELSHRTPLPNGSCAIGFYLPRGTPEPHGDGVYVSMNEGDALTRDEMHADLVQLLEDAKLAEASFEQEPEGEVQIYLEKLFGPEPCPRCAATGNSLRWQTTDVTPTEVTRELIDVPCPECGGSDGE